MTHRITLHIAIDVNGNFSVHGPIDIDIGQHKKFQQKHWPSWTHVYKQIDLELPDQGPPEPERGQPQTKASLFDCR